MHPIISLLFPPVEALPRIRCRANYSGGLSSWAAAKLYAERNGTEGLFLVFADTFIEDDDNYRFLIEGAAAIFGTYCPKYDLSDMPPISEPDERKEFLLKLASFVMEDIPQLVWISEGRDPWEVMNDERFLGNSRVDPCSSVLKRKLLARWMKTNVSREHTDVILGINWDEAERMDRVKVRNPGWRYVSPLIDYNVFLGNKHKIEWLSRLGIEPPRMYGMNFAHANCGGFCIKSGHGGFKTLLDNFPKRYAYHEQKEREIREKLGDVSILKCRRGGKAKRLTLEDLRKRIEADMLTEEEKCDLGGCTCALPI